MTTASASGTCRRVTAFFTFVVRPVVMVPVAVVSVCGIAAVAADMSHAWKAQRRLQNMANVSALAAAMQIHRGTYEASPGAWALDVGYVSQSDRVAPVADADIAVGVWDVASKSFTETTSDVNATRATVRSQGHTLMPVTPRLMQVFGIRADPVITTATAAFDSPAAVQGADALPRIVD